MTNNELGIYMRLLSHCWLQEGLPDDMSLVRRLAATGWTLDQCSTFVGRYFYKKDSRWQHKRLDFERAKQEHNRLQQQKNSLARWNKPNQKISRGIAAAMPPQSSSSASSSPTPVKGEASKTQELRTKTKEELREILTARGGKFVGHEAPIELEKLIRSMPFPAKENTTI